MKVEVAVKDIDRIVASEMRRLLAKPICGITEDDEYTSGEIHDAAMLILDFYT